MQNQQQRREFMKTAGATAVLAGATGVTSAASAATTQDEGTQEVVLKDFGVYDEWGPLKEVVVGRADTAKLPDWHEFYEQLMAPSKLKEILKKHPETLLKEVYPEFVEEYQEQLDNYASTLEKHGVKVHRPRELTKEELATDTAIGSKGIWQCAPADEVWVVGRNFMEMELRSLVKRKNKLWAREIFMPHILKNKNIIWQSTPIPSPAFDQTKGPYTEGGDIILVGNGKDVLMGVEKSSTDELGFSHTERILAMDGYRLHKVYFDMYAVHLLAQMNLINPGLGVICWEAFEAHGGRDALPKIVRDWDYIGITKDEVHKGGCDVVMIDEKKVIVPSEQPRVAEELAKKGLEPIPIPLSRAAEGESGPRCQLQIIHREKSKLSV